MNELVSLNQIVSEIKFFENQAVVSYWEIGKRLNQAKNQVGHGEWMEWVERNLGYSQETTNKLMRINNEFPNSSTLTNLTFSKALALTSIKDEEERQDFIENHEVEDMTTRELQAEIKEYKESLKAKEEEFEIVNSSFNSLKIAARQSEEENARLREDLRQEREKPAEVIEKEVIKKVVPDDYELTKVQLENANKKLEKLMDINQSLKEKEKLAMSKLESEQANKKIVEDVSGFHYKIAGFIQEVGGLLYLTEYLDNIPKDNKKLFLDSAKYLREFSEQLYKNIEGYINQK
ncbi:DUF3102 domain-containing protein [Anaerococcus sp. Marseille-P3915]|uniref:DUF3102 domain-containing protein n=1 Tax=Anaerococcus sp. Marseille-P3915 TaxID=2057799 RepID=UPI000D0BB7C5|nr:DUF3102 domain-containing protein [Anaerococcus sp. Marseille-P3915]